MSDTWFDENIIAFVDGELSDDDLKKFEEQIKKDPTLQREVDEHRSVARLITYTSTPETSDELSLARMKKRFMTAYEDEIGRGARAGHSRNMNSPLNKMNTEHLKVTSTKNIHDPSKKTRWLPYIGVSGIAASLFVFGFLSLETFNPPDISGMGTQNIYRGLASDPTSLEVDGDGFGLGVVYVSVRDSSVDGILENSPFKFEIFSPLSGKLNIFETTDPELETLVETNIDVIKGKSVTLPSVDAFTVTDMEKITFKFVFTSSDKRIEKIKTFEVFYNK